MLIEASSIDQELHGMIEHNWSIVPFLVNSLLSGMCGRQGPFHTQNQGLFDTHDQGPQVKLF